MKTNITLFVALASALGFSAAAHAQSAGTWQATVGVVNIAPQVDSGNLSAPSLPNTKIDVKPATTVILGVTYMVTDNFSAHLALGWPPRHEIVGADAINGVGKLGSIVQYSPTLLGQYRFFDAKEQFRPYLGAGATYASFGGGKGTAALTAITNPGGPQTTPSADSAFGLSIQGGASYAINEKWFVDGHIIKTFIKVKNKLSTGQTLDAKLNPLSVGLAVGYRF
jgi:outer membrane protein